MSEILDNMERSILKREFIDQDLLVRIIVTLILEINRLEERIKGLEPKETVSTLSDRIERLSCDMIREFGQTRPEKCQELALTLTEVSEAVESMEKP